MRQVLAFLLVCLVLRMFFPDVAAELERAMLAALDLINQALAAAVANGGHL